ncbi:MAG: HD domain-containing protein [Acidobacteriota bacterium]
MTSPMTSELPVSALGLPADLEQALRAIADDVAAAGGRALVVGGSVRDALLGSPVDDLDLEVFGLGADRLQGVLSERFELDAVGRSFGVLKVKHLAIDVSLPRRESKRGTGHKGFVVDGDPHMGLEEAASRRDFTINAMAYDPRTGELLDPWGGRRDLDAHILRHVSHKFAEDPLRVLRGMQMAARFELKAAPETLALASTMGLEGLAAERIFGEWRKLIVRGRRPSLGLDFLRQSGWTRYFPELVAMVHCPQDPEWHPEGDVWTHTLHVLDAFADERIGDDWEDLVVGFACLCHDIAKPTTTHFERGRWRSPGHEEAGDEPTRTFLARLNAMDRLVEAVVPLVREHLKPFMLHHAEASAAAIRRLARRVKRIDRLVRVARADHRGRPPLPWDGFPAGQWLLSQAEALALEAQAPKPIVLGRHLIDLGLSPGKAFGPLLDACFEAQLDGAFEDIEGGLSFTRGLLSDRGYQL